MRGKRYINNQIQRMVDYLRDMVCISSLIFTGQVVCTEGIEILIIGFIIVFAGDQSDPNDINTL